MRSFGSRTLALFGLMAAVTSSQIANESQPVAGEQPKASNKRRRKLFARQRYPYGQRPHQGEREMLRRRMGGFHTERRMNASGFFWNDHTRTWEKQ